MTYDHNQFLIDLIIQGDHHLIDSLCDPSVDQLKQLVDIGLFCFFPDEWKLEEICLCAVRLNCNNITYIKNPSEKVQLSTVQNHGWAICYINDPSKAVQLAAVRQAGSAIKWIKNPSNTVQIAAVRQDCYAMRYIKKSYPRKLLLLFKILFFQPLNH